ncbi:MAG: LOG family protein, partial [Mariprofundaceae bacterium]
MTPPLFDELPDDLRKPARELIEALRAQNGGQTPPWKRAVLLETLKLIGEDQETADLKLLANALREIRTGFDVFRPYKRFRKVSVFGSARTPSDHPRYLHVRECARRLKEAGFMIITGGGGGLMQAANEGAGERHSFGININLPMEQKPNPVVEGSPRHFYCKYFFTRKLFFLKESDAVVLSPGGFGTLDEAFETLTLLQTGRNPPIPVVLLEAPDDDYWGPFVRSWLRRLIGDNLISPDDTQLLFHTDNIEAAVDHIRDFYINYDSFRYVGDAALLRLIRPLSESALERLNAEFSDVLR